jgi:flagellar biosynthetic protein FlhB
MAEERQSGDERTEQPTPRRREEARREGQVARSAELSSASVMLAGAVVLAGVGGASLGGLAVRTLRESARALSLGPAGGASAVQVLRGTVTHLTLALVPFAAVVIATAVFVNAAQTGGVIAFSRLKPKFSQVDPFAGIRRMFSAESGFQLLKSVVKLAALGLLTFSVIRGDWSELMSLAQSSPSTTAVVVRTLLYKLAVVVGLAFLAVAAVDYLFQRSQMQKRLRMSKQEVMREYRESEGDPILKGRILSISRARARQRMLSGVPTADVVVVNPVHIAVALRYDIDEAPAPIVVAMGERKLAEKIKEIALASGVPIIENIPVAHALKASARVGSPIPATLFGAIAEILAFVYRSRTLNAAGAAPWSRA